MIKTILTTDEEYPLLLELRNVVLRIPLGMDISNDDLSDEQDSQHLAYCDSNEIIGCLKIKHLDDGLFQVQQMAVLPQQQRRGIGAALLCEAESIIRKQGGVKVVVEARHNAVPFYINNGYLETGQMFEKVNIPHQRMIKSL